MTNPDDTPAPWLLKCPSCHRPGWYSGNCLQCAGQFAGAPAEEGRARGEAIQARQVEFERRRRMHRPVRRMRRK